VRPGRAIPTIAWTGPEDGLAVRAALEDLVGPVGWAVVEAEGRLPEARVSVVDARRPDAGRLLIAAAQRGQIGRASCRERV
jgi:hypothetical protein